MRKILLCLFLLTVSVASAKTVRLQTGHFFFDTERAVDLDNFDYKYKVRQVLMRGNMVRIVGWLFMEDSGSGS